MNKIRQAGITKEMIEIVSGAASADVIAAALRQQLREKVRMASNETKNRIGHVVEVIGPVVDVQFQEGHLPLIHNAVRITSEGFDVPEPLDIVAEVEQHLGEKAASAPSR